MDSLLVLGFPVSKFFLLLLMIFSSVLPAQSSLCRTSCGGIPINYPFGIDDGCGNPYYRHILACSDTGRLQLRTPSGNYPVQTISYTDPHILVFDPDMWTCQDGDIFRPTKPFSLDTSTHLSLSRKNEYLFFNCSEDVIVKPKTYSCERFPEKCDSSCDSASYLCRHMPECGSSLISSSCCSYYPKATESLRLMLNHCTSYTSVYWRNIGVSPVHDSDHVPQYGIRVDFDIPVTTRCLQCQDTRKGGGTCGFDTQTESFLCLCQDGNSTTYCKDHESHQHKTMTRVIAGSALTAAGVMGIGAGILFVKKVRAKVPRTIDLRLAVGAYDVSQDSLLEDVKDVSVSMLLVVFLGDNQMYSVMDSHCESRDFKNLSFPPYSQKLRSMSNQKVKERYLDDPRLKGSPVLGDELESPGINDEDKNTSVGVSDKMLTTNIDLMLLKIIALLGQLVPKHENAGKLTKPSVPEYIGLLAFCAGNNKSSKKVGINDVDLAEHMDGNCFVDVIAFDNTKSITNSVSGRKGVNSEALTMDCERETGIIECAGCPFNLKETCSNDPTLACDFKGKKLRVRTSKVEWMLDRAKLFRGVREHTRRTSHLKNSAVGSVRGPWNYEGCAILMNRWGNKTKLHRWKPSIERHCHILLIRFLLTRTELPYHNSSSDAASSPCSNDDFNSTQCWTKPLVKRVLVIIIDALRFDFVAPSSCFQEKKPWMDRLTVLQNLALMHPSRAKIFKFIADPPTTTLQRLKGLTTGGLPTFIDIGHSFGAPAIVEDNFLYQLVQNGRKVVMMGDDTWMQLFPHHFDKSYPFPSFNVKDLHTVDNGCIDHLIPSLYKKDWDVLIAHFLGVDHAGHIYGVDSGPMVEKLDQYNAVLEKVIEILESQSGLGGLHENSLLLVMGDHGQTLNGDHGGGTFEEVETSLFAMGFDKRNSAMTSFKNDPSYSDSDSVCQNSIQQLNFAVSVSALLGIPFPFGSIGTVEPELYALVAGVEGLRSSQLENCENESNLEMWMTNYVNVLCMNSWQVKRYIDVYSAASVDGFSSEDMMHIADEYAQAQRRWSQTVKILQSHKNKSCHISLPTLQGQIDAYSRFLDGVAELARSKWTKFNRKMMGVGLVEEGKVANFLLATSSIFQLRSSVKKNMMLPEAVTFFLLAFGLRFPIELGLSKQAATSLFMSYQPSWLSWFTSGHPIWMLPSAYVPVLALLFVAYLIHKSSFSCTRWEIYDFVIKLTISSYMLLVVHFMLESNLLSVTSASEYFRRIVIPRTIYGIGLGKLLLLAVDHFRLKGKAVDCHASLLRKTSMMFCTWSPTIILLSGSKGSYFAIISIIGVTQWSLLAVCLFFATGHWCAFDGLRYGAAFIGFDEFVFVRQAVFLAIETFGFSHILPILGLPLLVSDGNSDLTGNERPSILFKKLSLVLEDYLRCYVSETQSIWVELLPWAELHYNTAVHSGLGASPFEAVYGRKPPSLLDYIPGTSKVSAVDEVLTSRTDLLKKLRENLLRAQLRMTQKANKHRSEIIYQVGDWVYLRLRPYRQTTLRPFRSSKLAKRYYGPFKIVECIGPVAYRLALPESSRIHDVFHVSTLKRCNATPPFSQVSWPDNFSGGLHTPQPETILGHRQILQGDTPVHQLLVQWVGHGR
ncbi:unnamed protein product [Rhodiola kirilowii]